MDYFSSGPVAVIGLVVAAGIFGFAVWKLFIKGGRAKKIKDELTDEAKEIFESLKDRNI